MLKKIRAFLYPFPKGIWFNNPDESKGVIYPPFKEELKDWRFWVVILIILAIAYIARHYGNLSPVDIRDWHYG